MAAIHWAQSLDEKEENMRFTVVLTPDEEEGGFTVECPAIPGCISEGDTVDGSDQE